MRIVRLFFVVVSSFSDSAVCWRIRALLVSPVLALILARHTAVNT